jgi:transcriptional regulator with XRE-family HTH domain
LRAFHSPRYKLLCQRLRAAREHAGFTQVEAAKALGYPQNFVSKCETGERRIDAIELAEFAELYRTTVAALIPPPDRTTSAEPRAGGVPRARRVAEPKLEPKDGKHRGAGKGASGAKSRS